MASNLPPALRRPTENSVSKSARTACAGPSCLRDDRPVNSSFTAQARQVRTSLTMLRGALTIQVAPAREGSIMPRYEYLCEACGRTVTLRLSVSQHDSAPACPECGSKKLTQLITPFLTQTSRKT